MNIRPRARKAYGWPAGTWGAIVRHDLCRDLYLLKIVDPQGKSQGLFSVTGEVLAA